MIRRPPRSTLSSSSAASDVYKRQAIITPEMVPKEIVIRSQCSKGLRGCIGKRGYGCRRCYYSEIIGWRLCTIPGWIVGSSQSPDPRTITRVFFGIYLAIRPVYERLIYILFPIIGKLIFQVPGIEPQK